MICSGAAGAPPGGRADLLLAVKQRLRADCNQSESFRL